MSVRVLAPLSSAQKFQDYIRSPSASPWRPFSPERCQTLNRLSQVILNDSELRSDPSCVALAYWLRRANFEQMGRQFDARWAQDTESVAVPVGRVFHIAPSNVDTFFVYSWALSFACGNSNIVRVSGQQSDIVTQLIRCINEQMEQNDDLRDSNFFVTYEHNDEVTEMISRWCSHRIIWGGNETISRVRPLFLNPHASERVFGSKFSYCVISAGRFNCLAIENREHLARDFFNDVFSFDQMACSSPHVVFWVGLEEVVKTAISNFSDDLQREVERRHYMVSPPQSIHRLNFVFEAAAISIVRADLRNPGFVTLQIDDPLELKKKICGGGLLTHTRVDELKAVACFAGEEDQTITYFGFEHSELRELARVAGAKGVDRLVPIGKALSFTPAWDGFDLLGDFVRIVSVLS